MGEVYRADDLKLGQSVALKLLPPALAQDPALLERFYAEVRLARQVSHPNVCRVYDVSEIEGRQVLSMELIDGEDLATLLRRIGRLAPDKAVEIARQICAGLAAAHDRGILHRDLKPANIMLDGRGHARITDFGLAALVGGVKGEDIRSGTPVYMAPEQFHGREVSVRSDIYSLGVVLYEIFTGKRVFEASSIRELMTLHDRSRPVSMSSHVEHLDPVIERVVLRCLEKDPADRPPSALAVAAALPGGDPLAAALAAGETPSPEMVAAAGGEGALRLPLAAACLAGTLAALVLVAAGSPQATMIDLASKPPSVLAEKARDLLAKVGYTTQPADSAHGFSRNGDYLRWIENQKTTLTGWGELSTKQRPALTFWYRQGPSPLEPQNVQGVVWPQDPPPLESGMAQVVLDTWGRLISMTVVPPQIEEQRAASGLSPVAGASQAPTTSPAPARLQSPPASQLPGTSPPSVASGPADATDNSQNTHQPSSSADMSPISTPQPPASDGTSSHAWSALFEGAGLDLGSFRPSVPRWTPLYFADSRAAWEGPLPWQEGVTGRVEAASYKGRPVYFSVLGPWSQPSRMRPYQPSSSEVVFQALNVIFFVMLLVGAVVLARWNIRLGRGDRQGAFRLALFLFVLGMLMWLARADHVSKLSSEWEQFVRASARALFDAGLIWLLYMALEPFIRRRWPESIVAWTRLIGGRFSDPLVGRDVLVGTVFGAALLVVERSRFLLESASTGAVSTPAVGPLWNLAGPGIFVANLLGGLGDGIQIAMIFLFFLFLGILPSKVNWRAPVIFGAIYTFMSFLASTSTSLPVRIVISVVSAVLVTTVLARFGALAAIAANVVNIWGGWLNLDFSSWYAAQTIILWILLITLGAGAFVVSLGRRGPLHALW